MKESSTIPEGGENVEVEQLPETRRSALLKIASGTFAILMTDVLKNNAEAKVNTATCTDFVDTVQINTFGDQPRTSIIYRDADGIIDWRWYTDPKQIPCPLGDGRYIAVWEDEGKPRTILCWHVNFRRTKEDIELQERAILPEHRRRKLSK